MFAEFKKLPLTISLFGLLILTMFVPVIYGFLSGEIYQGRTFLYAVLLGFFILTFVWLASRNNNKQFHRHANIWAMISFFTVFPLILSIPLNEILVDGEIIDTYLDMVSVFTTTGLKVFPNNYFTDTLLVWRVFLGWTCGFLMWVFAWSIFFPMKLGGFELLDKNKNKFNVDNNVFFSPTRLPSERFWNELIRLVPIYFFITLACALGLLLVTRDPFFSILRAMATIATFGIQIPGKNPTGISGEFILLLIMVFAFSRTTVLGPFSKTQFLRIFQDPEVRLGFIIVIVAAILIFFFLFDTAGGIHQVLMLSWATLYTCVSFLTTTGLVSEFLAPEARSVIEVNLIFLALAIFGGGVATTAGGIKLLRIYILASHCRSEVNHLLSPAQVINSQKDSLARNNQKAVLACIFFMVFILIFALIIFCLTLTGSSVQDAGILTLATMTNTGPVAEQITFNSSLSVELKPEAKTLLAISMVLGRLEVLAVMALFNPDIYN